MRSNRSARFWLVALLLVSAAVAGGTLFAKYKLEGLREQVLANVRSRISADMAVASVSAFGLRGLKAEGVSIRRKAVDGTEIELNAPLAYIYIDLVELLYGDLSINRVQMDGSSLAVRRTRGPADGRRSSNFGMLTGLDASAVLPFRVSGSGCRVSIVNLVDESTLELDGVDFDVSRLPASPVLTITAEGNLSRNPAKRIRAIGRYASVDDYEISLGCTLVDSDDVSLFLPAPQRFVATGTASPNVRIQAHGDARLDLRFESTITDMTVRDQPEFLEPATGTVTAFGTYDTASRVLTVSMAEANTNAIAGNASGTIRFGDGPPDLDLTFSTKRLPVEELLNFALGNRMDEYGTVTYSVDAASQLSMTLSGSSRQPVIRVRSDIPAARFAFTPKDKQYPTADLEIGRLEVSWDSLSREPSGSAIISDGTLKQSDFGVEVAGVTANVVLESGVVSVHPLTAMYRGQPLIARARYELASQSGELNFSGMIPAIEETKLGSAIRNVALGGSATVNTTARLANGKWSFEGDVDASQAEIGYRWWFLKGIGIGATGRITGTYTPQKSASLQVTGTAAGSELSATLDLAYDGKKWGLRTAKATSDKLDVVSIGKCLPLPYVITGGTGRSASYEWTRTPHTGQGWHATLACEIDEIALRAEDSEDPFVCKSVTLAGELSEGKESMGALRLHASSVTTPPLRGGRWFAPMSRDLEKYPPIDRDWTYELSADTIIAPPWEGRDFTGEAYMTLTEIGLKSYSAKVGDGTVSGTYVSNRTENSYETKAEWRNVPSTYLLKHLNQPDIFMGDMTGEVRYSQDRDDPRTLSGLGSFEIRDGQFSADYLISRFEQQLEGEVSALPPSLRFSTLQADVEFQKDVVRTPRIHLASDAMELNATGQFVIDGDMNYSIKIAVSPEAAERIPLLRDNFNVQGHRIAQQRIDLAFTLSGPTIKPSSRLEDTPPVHVTLVSGALEAANEALRVIDAPRKILVDLLKIGGGIMGARKPPQSGNAN